MATLKLGASGPDVVALQRRLKELGFSPGAVDGDFGPGTEAAVLAFQRSEGLLADGIVGPRTATLLGLGGAEPPPPPGMPKVTTAIVSRMFPATPLDPIKRNLPPVLDALQQRRLTSVPIVAAALATIRAEAEGFEPIDEQLSRFNSSVGGRPFDLYDRRKDLGNTGPDDGEQFRGRGYVQLTGRANYARFGAELGVDLVERPQLANDPALAARLLAAFIASKEIAIKQALVDRDLAAARRLVNGGSHGLDRFSDAYETGIDLIQEQGAAMKEIIDIARPGLKATAGAAPPRKALDDVIATPNTVLCLVFGGSADAGRAAAAAQEVASKQETKPVLVVRIWDDGVLTHEEAAWKPVAAGEVLTLLTFDRTVSSKMTAEMASDAGDLLIAMLNAIAGQ